MKQHLIAILILLIQSFAQEQPTVKLEFFSVVTLDEAVEDFRLISYHYPLKSNIDNKLSTVYVSDKPTHKEIADAALRLPSDFFLISRNKVVVNKIILLNKPVRKYYVASPQTGDQNEYDSNVRGHITESRANEMLAEKYDTAARIEGGKLYFDNGEFQVIPQNDLRAELLQLIKTYQLSQPAVAARKPASPPKQPVTPAVKKTSK